jgi:hypothetical protein
MFEDGLHGPEALHQRHGRFLPDAADAGDVVDRVPHEPEHIGHARGRDAEPALDLGHADAAVAKRVEEGRALVDELHHVLVAGDDDRLHARSGRLRRQRADDVVRLDAPLLDDGEPQGCHQSPDVGDLGTELLRHRATALLVPCVQRIPEGLPGGVEDHRHVVGGLLAEQLRDHLRKAQDGVRRQPARGAERREGVERAVDIAAPIDQVQAERVARWHR